MKKAVSIFSICLLLVDLSHQIGSQSEHISVGFFIAGENADRTQNSLCELMDRFSEHLQLNSSHEVENILSFLEQSLNSSIEFTSTVEEFFDLAKNESDQLLEKLQNVPSPETLTEKTRTQLNDYFTEMENLKLIFCGILDDVTEFSQESVRMVQNTLLQLTDVQNAIIERRNWQDDDFCRNGYTEFLWQSAGEVIQCANAKLHITYDIFSITKLTTYHVLKMLEHRIQKIYNCFLFGNYSFRCRFLKNAEVDFEKLHTRLDELQMYNEKQKRKIYWNRPRGGGFVKCIPSNFPESQMTESLKSCYSTSRNIVVL